MSKQVKFKIKKQSGCELIEYPDDISFFSNTSVDADGYIHADYTGKKKLTASSLAADRLRPQKVNEVKQVAFELITNLDGAGGWKRTRAEQRAKFNNDESELKSLFEQAEAIRVKSGLIEDSLSDMSYEQLVILDILSLFGK